MNDLIKKIKFKNRNGSALAFVFIAFLVVFILLSSVFVLSTSNTRQVASQEQGIHSEYIARSGAEAMFEYLMKSSTGFSNANFWSSTNITNEAIDFSEGKATVSIEKFMHEGKKKVKITSLGIAKGTSVSKKAILEFELDGFKNFRWSR